MAWLGEFRKVAQDGQKESRQLGAPPLLEHCPRASRDGQRDDHRMEELEAYQMAQDLLVGEEGYQREQVQRVCHLKAWRQMA